MKIQPLRRRKFIVEREWWGTMGGKQQTGYYLDHLGNKELTKDGKIQYYKRYYPAYSYKLIEIML